VKPGDRIPSLRLLPGDDATRRYAEASGDHNPIHLDPEAARAAGLPAPILHGLYTMAQVARCAALSAGELQLCRLAVDFRALGFPGEEIEVSGVVEDAAGEGGLRLRLVARQGQRRLIRNACALLAPLQPSSLSDVSGGG